MFNRLRCLMLVAGVIMLALPHLLFSQPRGSALGFDGFDDYVRVPDDPSLDMTDGVTIAAWIFLNSYTEWASIVTKGGIVDDGGALTPNNYTVHQSGPSAASGQFGHLRFTTSFGLAGDSHSIIPLHEWHHVAVTFDGATARFYLDGERDGAAPFFGQLQSNDDPLHIGVDFPGGDEYWNGCLDEVMVFNRALSIEEIRALSDDDPELIFSGLAGFWRFNEGHGDIAHDRSENGNHGRLFGHPTWKNFGAPSSDLSEKTANQQTGTIPNAVMLMPNYPNPFNPDTEIRFVLPKATHAVVKIFNALGEEIRTLVDEEREAGYHRVHWDGKDKNGKPVASGIYLYQLQTGKFSQVKTMSLLH